jgi:hypothetical protein
MDHYEVKLQGDQIGRIFACEVIVKFGQFVWTLQKQHKILAIF